ncbi:TetR/AcrR family transcriptional regulator [Streptomyces sp. NPDC047971]|uniref:TetR/AcrR family transcriptional regulator n=1 Tax=Streptomyces sp. NPDC047971 TaxID=3154499 RepID=UPI0033D31ABF
MARPREFDEERALRAAMEAFWRLGYEGTSTRDLCAGTGLGPSSLYNAFGDKRSLYLRALNLYHETNTAEQVALLQGPAPVKDRLRRLMVQAVDTDLDESGHRGCFTINAAVEASAHDQDIKDLAARSFDKVADALYTALSHGRHAGEIRADGDLHALARRIQSTCYGLRILARVHRDRRVLLDTVESTLASL